MDVHSHPLPNMPCTPNALRPCGKRIHGRGIPTCEIKVAEFESQALRSPTDKIFLRHWAWRRLRAATRLRWAATSLPSAHRLSLPPGLHRPANPAVAERHRTWCDKATDRAFALPESRMRNLALISNPSLHCYQSSSLQKRRDFVAARIDEFEILLIRHFILIDGKRGDGDGVRFILVVPAE